MGFRRISILDLCEFRSPPKKHKHETINTSPNIYSISHISLRISSHCVFLLQNPSNKSISSKNVTTLNNLKRPRVTSRIFFALRIAVSPRQDLHLNSLPDHRSAWQMFHHEGPVGLFKRFEHTKLKKTGV